MLKRLAVCTLLILAGCNYNIKIITHTPTVPPSETSTYTPTPSNTPSLTPTLEDPTPTLESWTLTPTPGTPYPLYGYRSQRAVGTPFITVLTGTPVALLGLQRDGWALLGIPLYGDGITFYQFWVYIQR